METGVLRFRAWDRAEQKKFVGLSQVRSSPGGCWWVPGATCQAACHAQHVLDISLSSRNSTVRAGPVLFPILRMGKPRLRELR